ncbi:MAG: acetolactate synthase large subunit, partial [Rhizobium sp.]
KIVVLDNAALGMVHQQQSLFYGAQHVASQFQRPTDLCALSQAFGVPAIDLGERVDAREALQEAFEVPGPCLIRVPLTMQHHVLPMVAVGKANTEAIE